MGPSEPKHVWKYLNRELPPLPERLPPKPSHDTFSSTEMRTPRAVNHRASEGCQKLETPCSTIREESDEALLEDEDQVPSYRSQLTDPQIPGNVDNEKRTHRLVSIVPQTLSSTGYNHIHPDQATFWEKQEMSNAINRDKDSRNSGSKLHRPVATGQAFDNTTPQLLSTMGESQDHPPRTTSLFSSRQVKEPDWTASGTKKGGQLYPTGSSSSNDRMRPLQEQAASIFMGNFVPLQQPSENSQRKDNEAGGRLEGHLYYEELARMNPYTDQTTKQHPGGTPMTLSAINDLANDMRSHVKNRRPTHLKNSHSESNALLSAQHHAFKELPPPLPSGRKLSRSESSPSISPLRQFPRREESPSPSRSQHTEHTPCPSRGRSKSNVIISPRNTDEVFSEPFRSMRNRTTSPSKRRTPNGLQRSEVILEVLDGQSGRPEPPPRSRSPIKRMFGEGGWLGPPADANEGDSNRYKKPGMMIYIKNKIEEFGQKADLSPTKPGTTKSDTGLGRRSSKVPISLSPSQQAKLYSDLELIICTVANRFLMLQYQEGRISAESLKKITDFWSSKGRPQVVEFQYDQATQRDLIIANLKSFQFHGLKGSNPHYIDAMLYNWKEHARSMSIRTFCYPDSVVQKQLHDTYLLLELLGAPRETFVGLRNVQVFFNATVEKVREKKQSTNSSGTDGASSRSSNARSSAEDREDVFDVTGTIATYYEFPEG